MNLVLGGVRLKINPRKCEIIPTGEVDIETLTQAYMICRIGAPPTVYLGLLLGSSS